MTSESLGYGEGEGGEPRVARGHEVIDDCAHLLGRIAAAEDLFALDQRRWRGLSGLLLEGRALRDRAPTPPPLEAEVAITYFPSRHDYADLLYPVAERLLARGRSVAMVLPRRAIQEGRSELPDRITLLPLEGYGSPAAYLRARTALATLRPAARLWAEALALSGRQRRGIDVLLQGYVWERELFARLLARHRVRAVLGLHFLLHPGLRGAVRRRRQTGAALPIALLQHGVFSHAWGEHDFAGADLLLSWGQHFSDELGRFGQSAPPALVVGNPKLERLLSNDPDQPRHRRRVLYLSTNGVEADERAAVTFVAERLPAGPDLEVVYRPHPDESLAKFDELIAAGTLAPEQLLPVHGDPYALIRTAEVVLGTQTTLLPEAVALGVPALQVLPETFDLGWTELGLPGVARDGDLVSAVRALMSGSQRRAAAMAAARPLVERMFFRSEGAADRAAAAVEDLLDAAPAPGGVGRR